MNASIPTNKYYLCLLIKETSRATVLDSVGTFAEATAVPVALVTAVTVVFATAVTAVVAAAVMDLSF